LPLFFWESPETGKIQAKCPGKFVRFTSNYSYFLYFDSDYYVPRKVGKGLFRLESGNTSGHIKSSKCCLTHHRDIDERVENDAHPRPPDEQPFEGSPPPSSRV